MNKPRTNSEEEERIKEILIAEYPQIGMSKLALSIGRSQSFVRDRLIRYGIYRFGYSRPNKTGIFHDKIGSPLAVAGRKISEGYWSWIRCVKCHDYLEKGGNWEKKRDSSKGISTREVYELVKQHQCRKEK